MTAFKTGDLCSLISGSPRMAVESVTAEGVSVVWCNEGVIYRDTFAAPLLRAWEVRDNDDRKPFRGDREGGGKKFDRDGGRGGDRGGDKGKPGWHGKPRDKTHFRKD